MTLAEAIAEMRDTRIAASVVIVPWRKAAEEAQARIAELQERDAQWERFARSIVEQLEHFSGLGWSFYARNNDAPETAEQGER